MSDIDSREAKIVIETIIILEEFFPMFYMNKLDTETEEKVYEIANDMAISLVFHPEMK